MENQTITKTQIAWLWQIITITNGMMFNVNVRVIVILLSIRHVWLRVLSNHVRNVNLNIPNYIAIYCIYLNRKKMINENSKEEIFS